MKRNLPHGFALFTSGATFVLLVAGALVTSTDSGLSVPDWPLSYGQWFPPMIGGIRFEHTHRMIAAFVGMLTLFLSFSLLRWEARRWLRWVGITALFSVIAQAALGAVTVIYLLPRLVSVAHACLAQFFFAMLASIALFTSAEWERGERISCPFSASLKSLAAATSVFLFVQTALGAWVRHGQRNDPALLPHLATGGILLVLIGVLCGMVCGHAYLRRVLGVHSAGISLVVLIQLALGGAAWLYGHHWRPELPGAGLIFWTTAHQAFGAFLFCLSVLLTLRIFRLLRNP